MAWIVLVLSGICEAVWAVALDKSQGFTKIIPVIVFFCGLAASMAGLSYAMRSISVGTAYLMWVGIGAAITVSYLRGTHEQNVACAATPHRSGHYAETRAQACAARCSSCSSARFISTPYAYPTRLPFAPITRWHGTMNRIGLRLFAEPTARTAFGRPTASAICA